MSKLESLTETEILALTIIGEARGEPIEGQIAVGCVVRNRFHANPSKYRNWHDVCLEPLQFSCWNEFDTNYPFLKESAEKLISGGSIVDPYLRQCIFIAGGVISWDIIDNTKGAKNYMTTALYNSDKKPSWAKVLKSSPIEIGKQIFINV
jgi:hypothetical protein